MSAIQFVARDTVGVYQQGTVFSSSFDGKIALQPGGAVSLNVRRLDITGYVRKGDDLVLLLSDGREILLEDYFGPDGNPQSEIYLNEGGNLLGTSVSATGEVEHHNVQEWGKWGENSALTFPNDPVVLANGPSDAVSRAMAQGDYVGAVAATGANEQPTMLAGFGLAPLVGISGAGAGFGIAGVAAGVGLLGTAAASAGSGASSGAGSTTRNSTSTSNSSSSASATANANAGGNGDGGGDGGGGGSRIQPSIDRANETYTFNGGSTRTVTVTGDAEPDSTIEVSIGGRMVTVTSNAQGRWSAEFRGSNFPDDGNYILSARVVEVNGTRTTLQGQEIIIDTTPPDIDVSGYIDVTGQVINAIEHVNGFTLVGTGEPDAYVTLEVNGITKTTTVGRNGTWSVDFARTDLPTGEYDIDVTITARDSFDNARTITHTMTVDTIAPEVDIDRTQAGDNTINSFEATAGVDITGEAEPGAAVTVTINGVTYATTASVGGTWVVTFAAADIPAGTYDTPIRVTATDAAGNSATTDSVIRIDTLVAPLASNGVSDPDGVLSQADVAAGVTLTGVVEAGSSVVVDFEGVSRNATVDGSGNWTVDFSAADIGTGEMTANVIISATDQAGNVRSIVETVEVDTAAPEAAFVTAFIRSGSSLRGFSVDAGDATVDLSTVSLTGTQGTIGNTQLANPIEPSEVDFYFTEALPNGSHLIITKTDAVGNGSATLFALDRGNPDQVDLTNPGFSQHQIEAVDLRFAELSELVINSDILEDLSTNSNTLTIHGSGDDLVNVDRSNGAAFTDTNTNVDIGGETYSIYTLGDEGGTLIIDDDIRMS